MESFPLGPALEGLAPESGPKWIYVHRRVSALGSKRFLDCYLGVQ